jgi:hypothetical protein
LFTFSYKILNSSTSSPLLHEQFKLNSENKVKQKLRNNKNLQVPRLVTEAGQRTFSFFFSNFINKFNIDIFNLPFSQFKTHIINNSNIYTNKLAIFFPKFDLTYYYNRYIFLAVFFTIPFLFYISLHFCIILLLKQNQHSLFFLIFNFIIC